MSYTIQPIFNGLVTEREFSYNFLLHDSSSLQSNDLAEQFNDLYHLFLNKFARLSQTSTISLSQEKEIKVLLEQVLAVRRKLEESDI